MSNASLCSRVKKEHYTYIVLAIAFLYLTTGLILSVKSRMWRTQFTAENDFGEMVAALAWLLSGLVCFAHFIQGRFANKKRTHWLWLGIILTMAGLRELDVHVYITNHFGIHFKTIWLTDPSVPLLPKIIMLAIIYGVGTVAVVPAVKYHKTILNALRNDQGQVRLFLLGMVVAALGFSMDGSLFGKNFYYHHFPQDYILLIEEILETTGALICSLSVLAYKFSLPRDAA